MTQTVTPDFPPFQLLKLFISQINDFFNKQNFSAFLSNLKEIEQLRSLGDQIRQQLKNSQGPGKTQTQTSASFLTIPDYSLKFFDIEQRQMCLEEVDFVYLCLNTMLAFSLRDGAISRKKIEFLGRFVKKIEEKAASEEETEGNEVTGFQRNFAKLAVQARQKLEFFKGLQDLWFSAEGKFRKSYFNVNEIHESDR